MTRPSEIRFQQDDHSTKLSRTVSEPALPHKAPQPGFYNNHSSESTSSQLPADIDVNKLERGDLRFEDDHRIHSTESSPLLPRPPRTKYSSMPIEQTISAPAIPTIHEPPRSPVTSPFPEPPDQNNRNGSYMSPWTAWLWRLYYNNRAIFYVVIVVILILTTIYTAFTGEGSRYYAVILRASGCYILGTDRAQSLFGSGFCKFGCSPPALM